MCVVPLLLLQFGRGARPLLIFLYEGAFWRAVMMARRGSCHYVARSITLLLEV